MHTWVAVLIVSVLWLSPIMIEAGTAGTTGPQVAGQQQIITKDNFKLIQERLKAEGVYAGSPRQDRYWWRIPSGRFPTRLHREGAGAAEACAGQLTASRPGRLVTGGLHDRLNVGRAQRARIDADFIQNAGKEGFGRGLLCALFRPDDQQPVIRRTGGVGLRPCSPTAPHSDRA